MKTKNNLLTGIIIGIGVIVLPLILMGTTTDAISWAKENTYKFHAVNGYEGYLLNSETGDMWHVGNKTEKHYKNKVKVPQ